MGVAVRESPPPQSKRRELDRDREDGQGQLLSVRSPQGVRSTPRSSQGRGLDTAVGRRHKFSWVIAKGKQQGMASQACDSGA